MPTAGMGSPALMPTTWHGVSSPHLKDHANSLGKDHANSLGKDHATDGYPTCTYMYLPERLDAQ